MIDTHAHINTEDFSEDREEVINRAKAAGVEKIIIPAIEPKHYPGLLDLVSKHKDLYCGIGVHPHNADEFHETIPHLIKELAQNKSVVAIGEIGLDYHYDFAPKDKQKKAFRKQLQIAKELDLPVIVHNRESDEDLLDIIEDEQDGSLKGVIHCFSSPVEILERTIKAGFHVSFTGNVTFKKSDHRTVLEKVPLDKFMIETDSPYMAPVPKRGKRNEPSYVEHVAQKIAEIKSVSFKEVIDMTTKTAKSLFRLSVLLPAFLAFSNFAYAQQEQGDEYIEESYEEYQNPFKKFIGFGPVAGINTVVNTYSNSYPNEDVQRNVTEDGLPAYGGTVSYSPLDILIIQGTYLRSPNNEWVEDDNVEAPEPNIDQIFEFSTLWMPNPYNKINFYGTLGFTSILRKYYVYNEQGGLMQNTTIYGLNTGLGFIINIPVENAGLFTVNAEWRINFIFNETSVPFDDRFYSETDDPESPFYEPVDIKRFYSLPRLTVNWYPEF